MVLADDEGVDADLLGQAPLLDEVADHLGRRQRRPVEADREVAEGAEAELEVGAHGEATRPGAGAFPHPGP